MSRRRSGAPVRLLSGGVLVLAFLLIPGLPPGAGGDGGGGALSAQGAQDTIRARVLDRVQQRSRPLSRDSLEAEARAREEEREGGLMPGLGPGVGPEGPEAEAAPTPMADADSVMDALLGLRGYESSRYEGKTADFFARDRRLLLSGDEDRRARFSGDGAELEADSTIVYDDLLRRVRTEGATTLTPERGEPLTSRTLIYDLTSRRGTARESRTRYSEGGVNWIIWGELDSVDENEAWMSQARFTSCDLDEPHYYFEARDMKVIREQVLVARSVRMYFDDVPVAWLPFVAQNLGSGRASGLLTPTFSMNDVVRTSEGYSRRISNIGYYWAMSDYSDAQFYLDWFSNNYISGTSNLRYRWARRFLDGEVSLRHFWRESGQRELALNTRHNWEYSERTRLRASARYASSSDFVREQSFDPREVTQSINSEGGLSHRFDWGSLNLGADRRQHLSDDRVEMTLPTASLSLSTLTLFEAPPTTASWYNNLTLQGSTNFRRRIHEHAPQDRDDFRFQQTDRTTTSGRGSLSLGLGNLSFSNDLSFESAEYQGVPGSFFPEGLESGAPRHGRWVSAEEEEDDNGAAVVDPRELAQSEIQWSTSLSYRQNFLGTNSFTPSLSLERRFARSDTIPEALESYVGSPTRLSFGASVRSDVYGFFPGFGNYEAIRHKLTPNLRYSYTPAVSPTELQAAVFGAREARVRNQLTIGLNQTFEARVRPSDEEDPAVEEAGEELLEDPFGLEGEEGALPTLEDDPDPAPAPGEPQRRERSEVVRLLALQTSSVTYDIAEADSLGYFLGGFTTTRLSNQISSDFLRGFTLSVEHDLFEPPDDEGGRRRLAPHLDQMNVSFSLSERSAPVRFLYGLLGRDPAPPEEEEEEDLDEEEEDPFESRDGPDTSRMLPGDRQGRGMGMGVGADGGWNAQISYSLRRPRPLGDDAPTPDRAQMIRGTLSFEPTEHWRLSWRTSYDVEDGRFQDHMVQLRRDLHRWEANFGFRQTVAGNWAFTFEVSLLDNRDIRFDHRLRSGDQRGTGLPAGGGIP